MFDKITDHAELSALMLLLMEAEEEFGKVYGPKSLQALEMYELAWEMPIFRYVDVDQSFLPGGE